MSEEAKKIHEEEAIGKTYDWSVAKRLLRYIKPYWRTAAFALVLTIVVNILGSLQPLFTQHAVDDFIKPPDGAAPNTNGLWFFSLLFFGLFFFRFLFSYLQEVLVNIFGQKVMFDLRTEIYTKLQRQEVGYYDKHPVGRIITRITSDVDSLNELFTAGVVEVLGDLVIIFAIIAQMFWLDWQLALVSLITVPLLFIATNWFRKHARRGYDRVRTRMAKLNAFLQEHISGAQTVQLFNAEEKARKRFHDINDDYRNANIETIYYYAIFYPLVDFIGTIGIAFFGAHVGSVFAACYKLNPPFGNALASFVVGHGVIEISTVFFCAGAGMMIGYAMINPGDLTRGAAVKKKGLEAVRIVIGSAFLLVIAGIIEGFLSPSALPPFVKFATGISTGIAMYSYLFLVGKEGKV